MRILISSYQFLPSIGGLETATLTLASGLAERGHEVTVVTATPADGPDGFPFRVCRNPGAAALVRLVRDADLVWQNHVSLRMLWPLLFVRRPLVIMHHIWLNEHAEAGPRFGALKRLACKLGTNVFVSDILRRSAQLPGRIIPNSYDEATFRLLPEVQRDRDVAFLGRLVAFKGADTVIDAVALLAARDRRVNATMIGLGPEEDALRTRATAAGIADRVTFAGPVRGPELACLLNRHRVMVVPSRWEEPFGIVVLEGLACGCVVVVADSGALPEVVGPCGPVFPKNDAAALAAILDGLLQNPGRLAAYRGRAPAHLAKFTKRAFIDACEETVREAVAAASRGTLFSVRN
ncbi:MAG: glycosyltransferase family 4 protein [Pseudorhodoplanes sp.]|nr:glycosyltransferase family 4 protein [Pseudorhodoplanes sp.]